MATPGVRGGGTVADRNNNPGNIKYGAFAQRNGAVGADSRGFAIFPTREHGFKAAENLLGGRGYQGLTLGQIGRRWAEGDPNWSRNVSRATGIPEDAVPTPEQRSSIARTGIPSAEGTRYGAAGGGAGGGAGGRTNMGNAVPSEILNRARQVALQGGPGAVEQFMAQQGYPRSGNWCGQFAASVVSSVGGTPPANPGIASNWRNFGEAVENPQPGDIAVRRGVRTGSTGSHVTVVDQVDPRTGRFTGLGGNQRGGFQSRFRSDSYEFRRAAPRQTATSGPDQQTQGALNQQPEYPTAPPADLSGAQNEAQELRTQLEQPIVIRARMDASEAQFRRTSIRRETDKELRENRADSYADFGAA
jgi:uncharacterized protein (TIGR02594 family)